MDESIGELAGQFILMAAKALGLDPVPVCAGLNGPWRPLVYVGEKDGAVHKKTEWGGL